MDKNYLKNEYYKKSDIYVAINKTKEFYNQEFFPVLFKKGNHKLPKNVLCWDLPCRVTCKYNCPNCYAIKSERQYKDTPIMRAYHYEIIKQALQDSKKYNYLMDYMDKELKKHVKYCIRKNLFPIVRIHASGDIFSKEYLNLLLDLITRHQDINFYTYTKQLDNKTIDTLNKIKNLNIVKSIIKVDNKNCINYGELEYIKKISRKLNDDNIDNHICPYGISDHEVVCMQDCTACLYCSHVLFKQH